jgi:hypothetical protein
MSVVRLLRLLVLCLLLVTASFGQTSLGTITGIVNDTTGAVVANATSEAKKHGNRSCL